MGPGGPVDWEVVEAAVVGPEFPALLAAAQEGSERAFSAIYRRLSPRLLRYFAAQAPDVGEDLAAETWLSAARSLKAFAGTEEQFRAWLFTIARRRLVEHWRVAGRRVAADSAQASVLEGMAARDDTEDVAVESLAARDAAALIARLLPPDQAEVVLLRTLGGLGVATVAQLLGKRPGTVRVLQHNALRRLGQVLPAEVLTG